jgi:hypothetical protein
MHDDRSAEANGEPKPIDSMRLDRTAFTMIRLHEASAIDKAYWATQSPRARLEALELMRQVAYGYDPNTARLERVLEVTKRTPR